MDDDDGGAGGDDGGDGDDIHDGEDDNDADDGEDVHDDGQVDAVPAADVTWWKDGKQIGNRDEFLLGDNQ